MGNVCNPGIDRTVVDCEQRPVKENKVPGRKQSELHKSDSTDNSKHNIENQVDSLESGNSGKLKKMACPGNMDQENNKKVQPLERDETTIEQLVNKHVEMPTSVDEQKETLVSRCSKESAQSSSFSIIFQEGEKTEKLQFTSQDTDEEVVVLEYVIPPEINIVGEKNRNTLGDSKTQEELSSPISVEQEDRYRAKENGRVDQAGTSSLGNELLAEKNITIEHSELAVKIGNQAISCRGNTVNENENVQQQLILNEEAEVHRLENEILEKKKLVGKQNETLARLSEQKVERARDLKNLENRVATIKLQTELKERAFIVASQEYEEKSSKTVTLIEGKLFKFGRGGMTHPKEKWVQLRLFPKGQVVIDYAELFFSEKFERNQITSVERGEKYLKGDGSSYTGRVFAVRTISTDKHKYMVFAVDSEELCEKWIKTIKRAFA